MVGAGIGIMLRRNNLRLFNNGAGFACLLKQMTVNLLSQFSTSLQDQLFFC